MPFESSSSCLMYAFQWSPDWQLDNTKLWRQKMAKNVIFMLYTDGKVSKLGNACFSPFTLSQLTSYCLVIRQTCLIKPVFLMTHVPTQWGFPEILLSSFKQKNSSKYTKLCTEICDWLRCTILLFIQFQEVSATDVNIQFKNDKSKNPKNWLYKSFSRNIYWQA